MRAIANLLRHPLRELNHGTKWLFNEGSWSFLPHERLIVDAAVATLPPAIQSTIGQQLERRFFVERIGGGGWINVIWYDDPDPALKIADPGFAEKTIRVFLKVDGKRLPAAPAVDAATIKSAPIPKFQQAARSTRSAALSTSNMMRGVVAPSRTKGAVVSTRSVDAVLTRTPSGVATARGFRGVRGS